jgi:hypothetical protein
MGHLLGGPGTLTNTEQAGLPSQETDADEVASPLPFLPVSTQFTALLITNGVVPLHGITPEDVTSPLHE